MADNVLMTTGPTLTLQPGLCSSCRPRSLRQRAGIDVLLRNARYIGLGDCLDALDVVVVVIEREAIKCERYQLECDILRGLEVPGVELQVALGTRQLMAGTDSRIALSSFMNSSRAESVFAATISADAGRTALRLCRNREWHVGVARVSRRFCMSRW